MERDAWPNPAYVHRICTFSSFLCHYSITSRKRRIPPKDEFLSRPQRRGTAQPDDVTLTVMTLLFPFDDSSKRRRPLSFTVILLSD